MRRLLSAMLYATVTCITFAAAPASAANIAVTCHAKDLQDAMENAKEGDILTLAPNCDYEITKPSRTTRFDRKTPDNRALRAVNTTLTIEGNGATIRPLRLKETTSFLCEHFAYSGDCLGGTNLVNRIGHKQMGIFTVVEPANLTLRNLKLTDGSSGLGSAIWQEGGKVSLESVTITNSIAFGEFTNEPVNGIYSKEGRGGAILQTKGDMTITDSTIRSTFAGNYGGAIYTANGKLDLIRTTIEKSSSGRGGGALYIENSTVQIIDSPLLNNFVEYSDANLGDDYVTRYTRNLIFGRLPKNVINSVYDPNDNLGNYWGMPVPSGGAIYFQSGSLSLSGMPTTIINNSTKPTNFHKAVGFPRGFNVEAGPGGGIFARAGTNFTIEKGATVRDNTPDNCNDVIAKYCTH